MAKVKVKIKRRALTQRINRALLKEGQKLVVNRSGEGELGYYYVVDLNLNTVQAMDCDLETLGQELEVLKPYEELESE